MAFDGFFYYKHCRTLAGQLVGRSIDKIYQIGRHDILLQLKNSGAKYLLISVQSAQPRILLIDSKPETPDVPPMFCMLLRKRLQTSKIMAIRTLGLERIIDIEMSASNQIGDRINYKLRIELMGKHSNMMLLDEGDQIIDAIKRIGENTSIRPVLPACTYQLPPGEKVDLLSCDYRTFSDVLSRAEQRIQKVLFRLFIGPSPALASTLCLAADVDSAQSAKQLKPMQVERLWQAIKQRLAMLDDQTMWLYRDQLAVVEFSAVPLASEYSENKVLDDEYFGELTRYYQRRRASNRAAQKAEAAIKRIDGLIGRTISHIDNLQGDIARAQHLDEFRLFGELLTANLHRIERGMIEITLDNYYDQSEVTIPLAANKSANQNAQHYFKRYNKAKTTLQKAEQLISANTADLNYFKQVRSLLEQAETSDDVNALIDELVDGGYLKSRSRKKQHRPKKLPPLRYHSSEGVLILVGRNNYQNDELTLKKSAGEHIWLHTKDIAGSHVIITAEFADIDEQTIVEAAEIAAYHSDARQSSQVPVDFTEVKYVKKAKGAKPGMVFFTDNRTIYVTPDATRIAAMRDSNHL